MTRLPPSPSLIALVATVAVLAAGPALASSSASSASSEGSSASSGSVSDSFESSSDSSKTDEKDKVAAGDYRLVRVAAATQPGKLALTLRQDAADGAEAREFVLLVPEATVQAAALATGDTVTAKSRSFGWEFAAGATQQPFYLVLHDTQRREFSNQKVQA